MHSLVRDLSPTSFLQFARHVVAALCIAVSGIACAQEWIPQRPPRLVVPFPPGDTADLRAQLLATPMAIVLGQQVMVDNRDGAGGVLSIDALAHAQPDGYTFGILSMRAHAANATLIAKLPGDLIKDFQLRRACTNFRTENSASADRYVARATACRTGYGDSTTVDAAPNAWSTRPTSVLA